MYVCMGQPVSRPFKVEKRSSVFFPQLRTSQRWCSAPLIHISLNFCKTGPGMNKGIVPTCLFYKFATRHMFFLGFLLVFFPEEISIALMGAAIDWYQKMSLLFRGNFTYVVTDSSSKKFIFFFVVNAQSWESWAKKRGRKMVEKSLDMENGTRKNLRRWSVSKKKAMEYVRILKNKTM